MIRILMAAALMCVPIAASAMDPRCNGSARYQAMSDADFSGHGTGHACAPQVKNPANFLTGIRSINVVMHRDRGARSKRYIVFASHFGCGEVWYNKADAMVASPEQCRRYAKDYGDGVSASCYSAREFRALSRNPDSHCSKNMNPH